jgi:hypothetical protein
LHTKEPRFLICVITDEGVVTMERRITQAFKNAEVTLPPSGFLDNNFQQNVTMVRDVLRDENVHTFQGHLLSGLTDNAKNIGIYSYFHDISTYKNGYGHPETLRLGRM